MCAYLDYFFNPFNCSMIVYGYKWLLSLPQHDTFHRILHCIYKASPLCPKKYSSFLLYFSGECSSLNTNIPPSAQKFGQLESRLRSLDLEVSTWAKGICGDHI